MSTQTPNIGLTKPAGNEKPQVSVINGNSDILDAAIGDVDVSTDGSLQSQVDSIRDSVSNMAILDTGLISGQAYTTYTKQIPLVGYSQAPTVFPFTSHWCTIAGITVTSSQIELALDCTATSNVMSAQVLVMKI